MPDSRGFLCPLGGGEFEFVQRGLQGCCSASAERSEKLCGSVTASSPCVLFNWQGRVNSASEMTGESTAAAALASKADALHAAPQPRLP